VSSSRHREWVHSTRLVRDNSDTLDHLAGVEQPQTAGTGTFTLLRHHAQHNRDDADMHHIWILSKSCSAMVLPDIVGAAPGQPGQSATVGNRWDEVNVKCGNGSTVSEVYRVPRVMRKVFGDGDGVRIRGANGAG